MRMITLFILLVLGTNLYAADSATVKTAVEADKMTVQDMRKWYTLYKGAHLYMKEYDAVGSKDFGDVFDKFLVLRAKVDPTKGNANFVAATSFTKFKELEFTPENKTDLADEFFQVSEGLKKAIQDAK